MISGIYIIINKVNGKIYIGESINVKKRLRQHMNMLSTKAHKNIHLQRAFNIYGAENFDFGLLEECEPEFCKTMEHYWCNMLGAHDLRLGYNIKCTSHNQKYRMAAETKLKISIAHKGKIISESAKANMKRTRNIRPEPIRSQEAKKAISGANKNRAKPVYQLSRKGDLICFWRSRVLAGDILGIGHSGISNVLLGLRKTAGGYKWSFTYENPYTNT